MVKHFHSERFGDDRRQRHPAFAAAAVLFVLATFADAGAASAPKEDVPLYVEVSEVARPPVGWVEFCASNPGECAGVPSMPRDIVFTAKAFQDLQSINRYVNEIIKPMTDLDHWGIIEKWSYPDDGYGDCEDYVLLKRLLLMRAGWPREALLITVVRDRMDEGHAVLTVKTDRGEFILDNQADDILPWFETGYRFVKRQSQGNPNVWVSLGDSRPALTNAPTVHKANSVFDQLKAVCRSQLPSATAYCDVSRTSLRPPHP
jgi:predicted transglutaminase-like cysteine proteinase